MGKREGPDVQCAPREGSKRNECRRNNAQGDQNFSTARAESKHRIGQGFERKKEKPCIVRIQKG